MPPKLMLDSILFACFDAACLNDADSSLRSLGSLVSGCFDAHLHASCLTLLFTLNLFTWLAAARLANADGSLGCLLGLWLL
jgi:hypothetical protein